MNRFSRLIELGMSAFVGLHQPMECPDIRFEIDSVSECIHIEIWINGYTHPAQPDFKYYLSRSSSDADIHTAENMLELCNTIKNIYLKNIKISD